MKYSNTVRPSREVRPESVFDDVAARFRHETANTCKLTHLLFVATRARIHHERDWIVFSLALIFFERLEHDAGDLVGGVRPDIDDFVVTFARRDDAFAILFFDLR